MDLSQKEYSENGTLLDVYSKLMDIDDVGNTWLLVSSPLPVMVILSLYLLVVLKIGPALMQHRKAYELTTIMRLYNVCQIMLNFYILYSSFVTDSNFIPITIKLSCKLPEDIDENLDDLKRLYMAHFWNYLVLKIMDLLDTVFMVVRKKNSHVTFLHVYHHVAMVFFSWVTLKYIKTHQAVIPGVINITIHTIMYSYYFLATFGPSVKRFLWWKRHLTKLQLLQFTIILAYLICLFANDCPIPASFAYIWIFNVFVILCLFVNFYVQAYILGTSKEQ